MFQDQTLPFARISILAFSAQRSAFFMSSITLSVDMRDELKQAVLYQQLEKKFTLFCLRNLAHAFLDLETPVNEPTLSEGRL